jgi:hypothetical protein
LFAQFGAMKNVESLLKYAAPSEDVIQHDLKGKRYNPFQQIQHLVSGADQATETTK